MNLELIATLDSKSGIGKNGKVPWVIPGDERKFNSLTLRCDNEELLKSAVIMGYNTWVNLPEKPLRGRHNIVFTRNIKKRMPRAIFYTSYEDFQNEMEGSIFRCYVIGGAQIYAHLFPKVDILHLTRVKGDFDCDVFFPKDWEEEFDLTSKTAPKTEKGITYWFETYER
jgi:dihydrofolate reductase